MQSTRATAWATTHASGIGQRRTPLTLRKEYKKSSIQEIELRVLKTQNGGLADVANVMQMLTLVRNVEQWRHFAMINVFIQAANL